MIEKRTMWLVETDLSVSYVIAHYDIEASQTVAYKYGEKDDFFTPDSSEHFFATRAEADAFVADRRAYLLSKMPEIKAYINEIMCLEDAEEFKLSRRDLMPSWMADEDFYADWDRERKVVSILEVAINLRMLCVQGESIPLDRISKICWHSNGLSVYTVDEGAYSPLHIDDAAEEKAIRILFGQNVSGVKKPLH